MREMKNSGVEWIGEIPNEWNLIRFRFIADIETGNQDTQNAVPDGQYPFYVRSPIIERSNNYTFEGDGILMAGDGAGAGRVFHFASGKYAVHQRVYRFSKFKYIKHELLKHYLENLFATVMDYGSAKTTVPSVRLPMIQDFNVCVPPISEQEKIIVYINEKCTQVDTLISNEEQQIEKLKAYKQSIITETVTKGLNPDAAMKDSGVEWIGNIPEHWEISRIGRHAVIILGKMLCTSQLTSEHTLVPYYCAANVHFDGIDTSIRKEMWFNCAEKEQYSVSVGDLLVVEGGAGGCAVIQTLTEPMYIQNSIMILRQTKPFEVRYFRYLLESLVKRGYIDLVCNKATIPHFTKDKLSSVPYPILSYKEQIEISDYLDEKCTQIDRLISIKQAKIEKLTQYKKSLIYEYVTGKKEV